MRAFPNEEVAEIVAVDLKLHWLELTAAQIRLEEVKQGPNRGPAASPQEIRAHLFPLLTPTMGLWIEGFQELREA